MFSPKETVFDRFSQTIDLFKNNFNVLFLPFFIYNVLFAIIWILFLFFIINSLWEMNTMPTDFFEALNNPVIIIGIAIAILISLVYFLIYIPFFILLIKSLQNITEWKDNHIKENISYAFSTILGVFKTYWYIFAYVAWIPAIIFIIWWILFNLAFFMWIWDVFMKLGIWFMVLWWIMFVLFAIYRWIKASFPIYSAIESNDFTKKNFDSAIFITNDKWWRILGNFILTWVLISIITSIVWWIMSVFIPSWINFESIIKNQDFSNIWDLLNVNWVILEIFSAIVNNFISTMWVVFLIIFSYIFYLRLKLEKHELITDKYDKQKENNTWNNIEEL